MIRVDGNRAFSKVSAYIESFLDLEDSGHQLLMRDPSHDHHCKRFTSLPKLNASANLLETDFDGTFSLR